MTVKPKTHHNGSPGIGWVVVQMVLIVGILFTGIRYTEEWGWGAVVTGIVLWMYAAWIGLAGVRDLGRNLTPLPKPRSQSELVTTGIYARMRHPLYSAMMAMGFGWGIGWGSIPALGTSILLQWFLIAKARHEENWLKARYSNYKEYAEKVPRFFPR